MGTRYYLTITCPECGTLIKNAYYAPTSNITTCKCPKCTAIIDLLALTSITAEDASNREEIQEIVYEILA